MFRFSFFTACFTLLLIAAGGLVTSTGSGLSVPDWPLSYGMVFPPMIGGIRFEHSHRVIAGLTGIFTLMLTLWLWRVEKRAWLRWFSLVAIASVFLQALLGGLTVKYLLPKPISVSHACLGQTFFTLICLITFFLSREWHDGETIRSEHGASYFRLAVTTAAFAFCQLILGAIVRHTSGGAFAWHLFGAFFVLIHAFFLAVQAIRNPELRGLFLPQILLFGALLFIQFFLGLGAYLLKYAIARPEIPPIPEVFFATAHQTVGAILLANFVLLAVRAKRFVIPTRADNSSDYLQLMKLRVTLAALATTFAGYLLASPDPISMLRLFHTLLAAFCIGAGGNALNQFLERDVDRKMPRTENRPLAQRRLSAPHAVLFGAGTALAGLAELLFFVSWGAFVCGAAIFFSYVFIYTPLKRLTWLNTYVGAFPGALPVVLGWIAGGGGLNAACLALFMVLYIWQIPHFYAIAWVYRKDYSLGGLKMRPLTDPDGSSTAKQILLFSLLLVAAAAIPYRLGLAGIFYLIASFLAGAAILRASQAVFQEGTQGARLYVKTSVGYILFVFLSLVMSRS